MRIVITNGPSKPATFPIKNLLSSDAKPGVYCLAFNASNPTDLWIVEPDRRGSEVIHVTTLRGVHGPNIEPATIPVNDNSQMVRLGNVEATFNIIPD